MESSGTSLDGDVRK